MRQCEGIRVRLILVGRVNLVFFLKGGEQNLGGRDGSMFLCIFVLVSL